MKKSNRVLTSVENLKIMEEKEALKLEKERKKRERKKMREEKAGLSSCTCYLYEMCVYIYYHVY